MKVFQDLRIAVPSQNVPALVRSLESHCVDGWSRDRGEEARSQYSMFVFRCSASGARPAATLFLLHENGQLHVGNILPDEAESLDYDHYNLILNSFGNTVVRKATAENNVHWHLTDPEVRIESLLTGEELTLLKRVVATGRASVHAMEEASWNTFVVSVHRNGWKLSSHYLERWLREEAGASFDLVQSLVEKFQDARTLLHAYDREFAGAA